MDKVQENNLTDFFNIASIASTQTYYEHSPKLAEVHG
jgi:hypothetical protein